jgi:hypothetical protein
VKFATCEQEVTIAIGYNKAALFEANILILCQSSGLGHKEFHSYAVAKDENSVSAKYLLHFIAAE